MRCGIKQDPHSVVPQDFCNFRFLKHISFDKAVPKKSPLPKPAATPAGPGKTKRDKKSSSSEDSSDSSDDEKPPAKQKPKSGM